ncbi:MAG: transcription antitermination factor NusB [Clostridia bacterium]|nr:transcription antitermination factor NusB [Clostridia bacterium]
MNRTKAREYAFVLIFEYKFQPDEIERIVEDFVNEYNPGGQQDYIKNVVLGTAKNIAEIDQKIDEASKDWKVERLSCVSLAVLRLAVYELLFCPDIPNAVSVNEAVGIAKKYEGEEAAPFVNGILGKIGKVQVS